MVNSRLAIWLAGGHGFGQMNEIAAPTTLPRLKFIDLARGIAILLMLEGHFIGLTLADEARDATHPVYIVWNFIRGFTAPLFFTVAGMIFTFLLAGAKEASFFKRVRVRKGFRRAAELLFWGYALQISVWNIPNYIRGEFDTWFFAFHVLQCIGVGLIVLILIAGLQKWTGKFSLVIWYGAAIVFSLGLYLWLHSLPPETYVPQGWPQLFQNTLRGPRSVFPIAPWLGFTFLGGAMGAYVRSLESQPVTLKSCLWFFILAACLKLLWLAVMIIPMPATATTSLMWFTSRATEVVAFLGILRWLEIRYGIGVEWMLRVGRETFGIYIVHVIVLYSGIFGIGINHWLEGKLGPWQATGGAALFIAVFIVFAQLVNAWKMRKRGPKVS